MAEWANGRKGHSPGSFAWVIRLGSIRNGLTEYCWSWEIDELAKIPRFGDGMY